MYHVVEPRRDLEAAAAIGVEERGKDRGRVERRETQEIDRPVFAHQGDCVKVANDAVVLYGRVAVWQHRTMRSLSRHTQAGSLACISARGGMTALIGRPAECSGRSVLRRERVTAQGSPPERGSPAGDADRVRRRHLPRLLRCTASLAKDAAPDVSIGVDFAIERLYLRARRISFWVGGSSVSVHHSGGFPRSTPTSDQLAEGAPAPSRRKKNVDGVAHPGCRACAAVTLTPTKSPPISPSGARADPLDTIIGSPTGVR